jgi:hypothetical protein
VTTQKLETLMFLGCCLGAIENNQSAITDRRYNQTPGCRAWSFTTVVLSFRVTNFYWRGRTSVVLCAVDFKHEKWTLKLTSLLSVWP